MSVGQNGGNPWTVGQEKSISNEMPSMTSNWNQNTFNPSLALRVSPFLGKRKTETRIQLMLHGAQTQASTQSHNGKEGVNARRRPMQIRMRRYGHSANVNEFACCLRSPTPVRQGTETTWGISARILFSLFFSQQLFSTTASHKTYYMICQHVVAHTLSLLHMYAMCNGTHRRMNSWCGGLHPNMYTIEKFDFGFGLFSSFLFF